MPTAARVQDRRASVPSMLVAAAPADPTPSRLCGRRRSLCRRDARDAVPAEWSGLPWFATHAPTHDPRVGSSWPLYFLAPVAGTLLPSATRHPQHRLVPVVKRRTPAILHSLGHVPEISCRASPPYFLRRVRGWLHPCAPGAWERRGAPSDTSRRRLPLMVEAHGCDVHVQRRYGVAKPCGGSEGPILACQLPRGVVSLRRGVGSRTARESVPRRPGVGSSHTPPSLPAGGNQLLAPRLACWRGRLLAHPLLPAGGKRLLEGVTPLPGFDGSPGSGTGCGWVAAGAVICRDLQRPAAQLRATSAPP